MKENETQCVECKDIILKKSALITTAGDVVCKDCADQRV